MTTPMSEALNALASRDMTGAEVSRLLIRKGFDPDSVATVVAELRSQGFVQDERTAGFVVEDVRSSPAKGRLAAVNKLEKRGVAPIVAKQAVEQLGDEQDRVKALSFVRSKPWKNAAQAGRALAVRGFEEDCIMSVLEELFPDE